MITQQFIDITKKSQLKELLSKNIEEIIISASTNICLNITDNVNNKPTIFTFTSPDEIKESFIISELENTQTKTSTILIEAFDKNRIKPRFKEFEISLTNCKKITITEDSSINISGFIHINNFTFEHLGKGMVELDMKLDNLILNTSNNNTMNLFGKVNEAKINTSSKGYLNSSNMEVKNLIINTENSGEVSVFSNEKISGSIKNSETLNIYGTAEVNIEKLGQNDLILNYSHQNNNINDSMQKIENTLFPNSANNNLNTDNISKKIEIELSENSKEIMKFLAINEEIDHDIDIDTLLSLSDIDPELNFNKLNRDIEKITYDDLKNLVFEKEQEDIKHKPKTYVTYLLDQIAESNKKSEEEHYSKINERQKKEAILDNIKKNKAKAVRISEIKTKLKNSL